MRRVYCDIRKCLSCHSCEIACAVQHSESRDLFRALAQEPRPKRLVRVKGSGVGAFPLRCHHCEEAPCIDACKTGATQHDPTTGKVLIDKDNCVGCWMCVMVCPFGAVVPNMEAGKALKCDLCEDHDEPACVASCPSRALYFEEFEDFQEQYKKANIRELTLK